MVKVRVCIVWPGSRRQGRVPGKETAQVGAAAVDDLLDGFDAGVRRYGYGELPLSYPEDEASCRAAFVQRHGSEFFIVECAGVHAAKVRFFTD